MKWKSARNSAYWLIFLITFVYTIFECYILNYLERKFNNDIMKEDIIFVKINTCACPVNDDGSC